MERVGLCTYHRETYTRQSKSHYQASIRTKKPLSCGRKAWSSENTGNCAQSAQNLPKDNENTKKSLQIQMRTRKKSAQEVFCIQEKCQALTLRSAYADEDCNPPSTCC